MDVPFSFAFVVNHQSYIGIQIKEARLRLSLALSYDWSLHCWASVADVAEV